MGVCALDHTAKPLRNRVELPPAWGIKDVISQLVLPPPIAHLVFVFFPPLSGMSQKPALVP